MLCNRCERDVPDFLWDEANDHPVLLDHPVTVNTTPLQGSLDQFRVSAYAYITAQKCSDANPVVPESILNLSQNHSLEEAVNLALGAASVCWDPMGNGVFMSERCAKIGEELVEYFDAYVYERTQRVL